MDDDSKDQNEDNEFIRTFQKKFITLPKHIDKFQKVVKNDTKFMNEDIKGIQIQEQSNSVEEILEMSRGKVFNSHSMKSLTAQQDQNLQKSSSKSQLKIKKQKVQKILTNRFSQYKQKLSNSINKLQSICEENFGGLTSINRQLEKHQLTREQLVEYYAKMLPKNTDFPQIIQKYKKSTNSKEESEKLPKLRSFSEKNIQIFSNQFQKQKQKQKRTKKQIKHNKWYIDPQKRFYVSKDKTLYDWRTEEGLKNVIRTEQLKIKSKEINNLIKNVKEKFHREPIFCKYVKVD